MKVILYLALLVVASHAVPNAEVYPLSDEFINTINSLQSTWTAGRNFPVDTTIEQLRRLAGASKSPVKLLPTKKHERTLRDAIPESFDAREEWPDCPSIGEIQDQGSCASAWAVVAVQAMTDRICIHSNATKNVKVSAQDLLTCCDKCGFGCEGGYLEIPWIYWSETGIVSGGVYGDTDGCKAYSFEPCSHNVEDSDKPACLDSKTPACVKECDSSSVSYEDELTFGRNDSVYEISQDEEQIQLEILTNGPVETGFILYSDFYTYKSGVYQHTGGVPIGGHAVKLVGWGVENDTPYWLATNSFGSDWGDNGFFKILRGSNHLIIENQVTGGLPKP